MGVAYYGNVTTLPATWMLASTTKKYDDLGRLLIGGKRAGPGGVGGGSQLSLCSIAGCVRIGRVKIHFFSRTYS